MSAVLEQEPVVEIPQSQTIVLSVSDNLMAGVRPAGAVALANDIVIDCSEMAQHAADQRSAWAHRIDQLKAMENDFLAPAKEALEKVKGVVAKWLLPARTDLELGREILGKKGLVWVEQEKARVASEQAEREALARKLRQEAEAKAAAERARAEEQAREARRRAEEAAAAQRKAEAEGNARAAAAAAAARAKAEEQARAAIENGEAKAQQVQLEAAAQVQAPVAEMVQIKGQSTKALWGAELAPGYSLESAKFSVIRAICGISMNADGQIFFNPAAMRDDLLAHLNLDTAPRGSLNKMASALKTSFNVPGFVAKLTTSIAGSRK